jgi:hypothetical protein
LQAQGARDQYAVDVRVDLGEVRGPERHGDAEIRQAVGELLAPFIQQVHRVRPLGLQPPLHAVRGCEGAQLVLVGIGERLQVAQHQRRHRIAAGQLDLRAGVARLHAADQRAQRHEHGVDVRG